MGMRVTAYYERNVRLRRPEICDRWCEMVLAEPLRTEVQVDGRIKHWGYVAEAGRYLRVVTLGDRKTVLTHFLIGGFVHEASLLRGNGYAFHTIS